MQDPIEALVWYVVFLGSVTLHEAGHAWAAKRGGDLTAYHGGQVSIDPRPHIRREPLGMVILPVLSLVVFGWPFGFASTPYDRRWAQRHPRRAAWMSLAGPAANLLLVVAAGVMIRIGIAGGVLQAPDSVWFARVTASPDPGLGSALALLLSILFSLNLLLLVLNLIPLPPLDGSGALPLLLPVDAAQRYQQLASQPAFAWIGLLVAWNLFGYLFRPVFALALGLLYPGAHYG